MPDSASVTLHGIADTQLFARVIAASVMEDNLRVVLLKGTLGAGKTVLVREIVSSLPGGELAEVSSPSFTLMNEYMTRPQVKHFDLYRLDPFIYDESLDEALDDGDTAVFIEWAERIPDNLLPPDYLECRIAIDSDTQRAITLTAKGIHSQKALQSILRRFRKTI